MSINRKLNINYSKLCLIILGCTIIYNEYLSYWLCHLRWNFLPPPAPSTVVILLVADPQIVGNIHEPSGILGWIQRWDCDRYLSKSYSWALSSYDINTVVFMGDLIDEGSEADDDLFASYAERFHGVYPDNGKQIIYIPGDNDIGGEGVDPVTINKIDRFDKYFGPVKAVYPASNNIDIVPVSRLTEHGVYNLTLKPSQLYTTKIVLAVSHVPVLPLNGKFSERVMNLINPDMIFSAHDHMGYWFSADRDTRHIKGDVVRFNSGENVPVQVETRTSVQQEDEELGVGKLTGDVSEIVIPTASYRMGVPHIGLGLVSVTSQGDVFYTNLWLPSRFSLLYTYAASLIVVVLIILVGKLLDIRKVCRRQKDHYFESRHRYDPLLKL